MRDKKEFQRRGRTGREGTSLKAWGVLIAAGGLVWALLAFALAEGMSPLIAPVCLLLTGAVAAWMGRNIARGNVRAGSSAEAS